MLKLLIHSAIKLSKVIVGMEPTGHYWFSLARWLSDKGMKLF
jgi:transposase